MALSKEALELARSIDYKKGKAEGLRTYGFSHIRISKYDEAKGLFQEALHLFEELSDLNGQSSIYEYFGIIYRSLGDFDASLSYLYKALELTSKTQYKEGASLALYHLGVTYKYLGSYEKALDYLLQSLSIAQEIHYWVSESYALNLIGQIYFETADWDQALHYYQQSLQIRKELGDKWGEAGCLDNIGYTYYKTGAFNEAISHCTQSLAISSSTGDRKGQGNALFHMAEIYKAQSKPDDAHMAASESLNIRKEINDKKGQAEVLLFIVGLSLSAPGGSENAASLLQEALALGNETKALDLLANVHYGFYTVHKQQCQFEQALYSLETYNHIAKELHKEALAEKVVNLQIAHRAEQARLEAESYRLRNLELASLYEEIKKQKEETENQKQNAEASLEQLRETQAQLVQKEKMASLGELTAGIAHEIQNPLNFVNNFSELCMEMAGELKEELRLNNKEGVSNMADSIASNLQKVVYHGQRADAIVKSMLLHSRKSSGEKEPTDLNKLVNEYLRLAFHGMRARDASFHVTIETSLDEQLDRLNLVPQDIGRVLLNLFNNAFYAVMQKKQLTGDTYDPTVTVSTKKQGRILQISIKDNGIGIPEKLLDKIFQPFFTTKPAGEGTGLGLSLSYVMVKAYGGVLEAEATEGAGATFTISLPLT